MACRQNQQSIPSCDERVEAYIQKCDECQPQVPALEVAKAAGHSVHVRPCACRGPYLILQDNKLNCKGSPWEPLPFHLGACSAGSASLAQTDRLHAKPWRCHNACSAEPWLPAGRSTPQRATCLLDGGHCHDIPEVLPARLTAVANATCRHQLSSGPSLTKCICFACTLCAAL